MKGKLFHGLDQAEYGPTITVPTSTVLVSAVPMFGNQFCCHLADLLCDKLKGCITMMGEFKGRLLTG